MSADFVQTAAPTTRAELRRQAQAHLRSERKTQRRDARQLAAARRVLEALAPKLNSRIAMELWDGTQVALGDDVAVGDEGEYRIRLAGPGVIASLLRRPTPDNLLRHYARGHIDFAGTDLYTFLSTARVKNSRRKSRSLPKLLMAKSVLPFVFETPTHPTADHVFDGDETGRSRQDGDNTDFIQFHYDISNDFYRLFLDERMVYSCGYFTDWDNTVDQAQHDKLDITCRKLQLSEGDRYLDIGCGWGALVIHAAENYGVRAHGITLSEEQLALAQERVDARGLSDRVTLELRDYNTMSPQYDAAFDKVSSVGMVEHVGIDNMQDYMRTVARLMTDRGLFLNHGITRPAKRTAKQFRKMTPERRLLAKYIFPGGELDHLGHMIESTEAAGFEVHDSEGWRDHYALTCRLWSQRLHARRDEAVAMVGQEKFRMWMLYLVGCAFAFEDGSARIFQTLATRHASKGHSTTPPTRAHLYAERKTAVRRAA